MNSYKRTRTIGAGCILLILLLVAGSAAAIEYHLTAKPTTLVMPDGSIPVPAWGYAITLVKDAAGVTLFEDIAAAATVPGDPLEVPHNDPVLKIYLTNQLPEATSIHILGQTLSNAGAATFVDGRVMSFVHEAAAGGPAVLYQWDNLKHGTYLVQSATNPAKQVQMGLFAAVVKDFSATEAYPGVVADSQRIVVFHDVDPEIQDAIADDRYGESPGSPVGPYIPSSPYRKARYFLINGHCFPDTQLDPVGLGQRVLLRFVNAGLETHVPQILNAYLTQVAQDGIPLKYSREMYGFELNPAATIDAIFAPPAGSVSMEFTIYDAIVANMSNRGTYQGGAGGAVVKLAAHLDTDGDGVFDMVDNCTLVANADQRDTNNDGFGNICDPDLDDDILVGFLDFSMFRPLFGSTNADADFDGNGSVDFFDFNILRGFFGQPPGPSGVAP